jgi:beta-1,4-mannosyl-glycoprotein beta-1,4-N-acetylglucosaminyltransferase
MKIYDCFTFYNELDLLEIRLEELNSVVDYFVIVEATKTQTGISKKLYFNENKKRYLKFHSKIIHIIVSDMPNINKNTSWVLENFQRNQIIRGLNNCNKDDIIFISDLDEIPNKKDFPIIIKKLNKKFNLLETVQHRVNVTLTNMFNLFITPNLNFKNKLFRKINRTIEKVFPNKKIVEVKQKWYYYYLNGDANHTAINTRVCKYITLVKDLNNKPHNTRNIFSGNIINSGWHFSYLGGKQKIISKLKALADYETIKEKNTLPRMIEKIKNKKALVINKNMSITFVNIDNTFPKYIQQNTHKYKKYIYTNKL